MIKIDVTLLYCPEVWCCGRIFVHGGMKPTDRVRCPNSSAIIPYRLSEAGWFKFRNPLVLLNSDHLWPNPQKRALGYAICGRESSAGRIWQFAMARADNPHQCDQLRDLIGNPFRSSYLNPDFVSHDVASIAQSINASGNFGDMPVLADALEDAGCADMEILDHCRADTPHVRGCWLINLILGEAAECN